ncbi:GNAT family N-acetyltransferase [Tumebacillus sp. ITR2]|uniref:GNAT family N-acetyltransferase n=1 Tax=Tumebacillus amylolyticus TaxID=2801339 RepID=A0ABS1J8F6_9BACL|nr:GNAT family N-acetyltransferase [Tumebacillus amylolyticus]MBL0386534.1 GNAT family N-acetyltransferase [Tumebacillus amylolyticus]
MNVSLTLKTSFEEPEIREIARLEHLCNTADQIEIKAGTDSLASRPTDGIWDLVCHHEEQLVGYLCFYTFDGHTAEVISMVHPDFRRQGIFRALLSRAEDEMKQRGIQEILFVVPARSPSGLQLMQHLGSTFHEAEYGMQWTRDPQSFHRNDLLHLHVASTPEDLNFLAACLAQSFGDSEESTRNVLQRTSTPDRTSYIATLQGKPFGMIRVQRERDGHAAIFGFAVLPEFQGHGYGRQILTDIVNLLRSEDRAHIELDVVTENERGLHLYQSCGFDIATEYRYYRA